MLSELLQPFSAGLGIYPSISILIFVTVFALVTWRLFRMDKRYLDEMSSLPLDNDSAVNRDLED